MLLLKRRGGRVIYLKSLASLLDVVDKTLCQGSDVVCGDRKRSGIPFEAIHSRRVAIPVWIKIPDLAGRRLHLRA